VEPVLKAGGDGSHLVSGRLSPSAPLANLAVKAHTAGPRQPSAWSPQRVGGGLDWRTPSIISRKTRKSPPACLHVPIGICAADGLGRAAGPEHALAELGHLAERGRIVLHGDLDVYGRVLLRLRERTAIFSSPRPGTPRPLARPGRRVRPGPRAPVGQRAPAEVPGRDARAPDSPHAYLPRSLPPRKRHSTRWGKGGWVRE
jgi:hypothetical protein